MICELSPAPSAIERPVTNTRAPQCASSFAMPRPTPTVPPVTTAILPLSVPISLKIMTPLVAGAAMLTQSCDSDQRLEPHEASSSRTGRRRLAVVPRRAPGQSSAEHAVSVDLVPRVLSLYEWRHLSIIADAGLRLHQSHNSYSLFIPKVRYILKLSKSRLSGGSPVGIWRLLRDSLIGPPDAAR